MSHAESPSDPHPPESPAASTSPAARPPGRRWLRWTLIGAGGAAVLVAAAPMLLSTAWMNGVVRAWLDENVDRMVEFGSLDVSWSDGVRLRGVVVHDADPSQPPTLEASAVILRVAILDLLTRSFEIEEFVVVDPVVRIADRGETVSTARVVKLRRRGARRRSGAPSDDGAPTDPLILPDIRMPIRVSNLTLILVDAAGREVRRGGVTIEGRLTTRDGPTTFDVSVPTAGEGHIRVKGDATLFDAEGVLLARDRMRIATDVDVRGVDAQANADLLALVLPGRPTAGTVDAHVTAVYEGDAAKGSVDLHVRGAAIGDAVGRRAAPAGDDLTVRAQFDVSGSRVGLRGLDVSAEGLRIEGDVGGVWPALDGKLTLDADLARLGAALATMGLATDSELFGTAKGDLTFAPAPGGARGSLVFDGLRVESRSNAHAPVVAGRTEIVFAGVPADGGFRVETLDVRLADLASHVSGTVARDGTFDLRAETKGDLGGLLARARDLGMLPSGFSVRGTLDSAVAVTGRPGGTGDSALTLTIARCVLTEDDVRIEATGRATAGGDVDLVATGSGDLGNLLGRAQAAGAASGSGGPNLAAARGRFAFEARAKGTPDALVATLSKLRIDGDLAVDVSGEYRRAASADGSDASTIAATLRADGKVADAIALVRGLGLLDREVPLDGTLVARATVGGTAGAIEVPTFSVSLAGPTLTLDADGSIDAARKLRVKATGVADVARTLDVVSRSGLAGETKLPNARGRLTFEADASGTTDALDVPRFTASLRGGPCDLDVAGALRADGALSGTVSADGALADLAAFAKDAGWIERTLTPAGRLAFRADLGGTREKPSVPAFEVTTDGVIELAVRGSVDASRSVTADATFRGALQPLLDVAAQWSGGAPARLDGSLDGSARIEGAAGSLRASAPQIRLRAGGADVVVTDAAREPNGDARAKATVSGPAADLLAALHAFGVGTDVAATGTIGLTSELRVAANRATGALSLVATDVDVETPEIGGGTFVEPRLTVEIPAFDYDVGARKLAPMDAVVTLDGARIDANVSMDETPAPDAPADAAARRHVDLRGTLALDAAFARNHPELLADLTFTRAEGPFSFAGDVARGREGAAAWTGGADLELTGFVAPHVVAETAHVVAKIEAGTIVLDPIAGVVNGGPVTGTARLGLVGESPEHTFDFTGRDVAISGDLAPLVARASPIFAVGERGRAGGRAAVDVHLRARGVDAEAVKRSLTGKGTVSLADAFVESSDWIGLALSLLGTSGRLDIAPVAVPFEVRDGVVRTGEVALEGAGLLLRMGGDVGLDGKLAYGLRLKPKSSSSVFDNYRSLLDADGYLPLSLEGRLSKPKLRAPKLTDALQGKLEDLLGGVLGGKDDKDDGADPPKDEGEKPKGGGRKKKPKKAAPPSTRPPSPPDEPEPPPPLGPRRREPAPEPAPELPPDEPPPPPPGKR